MKFDEAMEYIDSLSGYGIVPGLGNIEELCKRLGNPQNKLKFVHIAGTNGKGSTLSLISTILTKAGYKVGRYISPTIYEYRERFQINGKYITKKDLCEYIDNIKSVCDEIVTDGLPHPTPFEVETAIAFDYFYKKGCDIVVLETGMGGLSDATNIVKNTLVSVIASVGMDHMQFLGNTLEKIAEQKCGIIKENSKVVTFKQNEEVMNVIKKTAEGKSSSLTIVDPENIKKAKSSLEKQVFDYKEYKKLELSLIGRFQLINACLAIEAVLALAEDDFKVDEKAIRKGLLECSWDGRFSLVGNKPVFIVDGAHNEDAARKLADSIEFYFTNKRIIYIMGMLKDKDYSRVVEITHKYASQIITVTPPNNKRALPAYELAMAVKEFCPSVTAVDSVEEAVEVAYLLAEKGDVIISFGSLSFAGKITEIVREKSNRK